MKIHIDRDDCTSCGTCWEACPEFFEMNPDDSLSQVIEKYRINGDRAKGTPPAGSEACARDSVDLCPVSIIHAEE